MTPAPENIVLEQLRLVREEMAAMRGELNQKIDALDHKVGSLAQTLIGVQRDIRRLTDSAGTLGAAVDEHTHRLDRIEKRLDMMHI